MSDKEFIEAEEQEGRCPSYFWYFIGSFGLTMVIVLVLIAYLVMYSDHFVWALRRNPNPSMRRKGKGKRSSASKASQMDDVSQQTSQQKNMPDLTT